MAAMKANAVLRERMLMEVSLLRGLGLIGGSIMSAVFMFVTNEPRLRMQKKIAAVPPEKRRRGSHLVEDEVVGQIENVVEHLAVLHRHVIDGISLAVMDQHHHAGQRL